MEVVEVDDIGAKTDCFTGLLVTALLLPLDDDEEDDDDDADVGESR